MSLFGFPKKKQNGDHVATIQELREILGENKVYGAEHVCKQMGVECENPNPPPFFVSTIQRCAEQNKRTWRRKPLADWRVVYVPGFSIWLLRSRYTKDKDGEPYFSPHFWLNWEESWLIERRKPKYWLINFKPNFPNMSMDLQKTEIANLGTEYACTPEHIVVQSLFTIRDTTGERLLNKHLHCGYISRLGFYDNYGLILFDTAIPMMCKREAGVLMYIRPDKQTPEPQ